VVINPSSFEGGQGDVIPPLKGDRGMFRLPSVRLRRMYRGSRLPASQRSIPLFSRAKVRLFPIGWFPSLLGLVYHSVVIGKIPSLKGWHTIARGKIFRLFALIH